MPIISSETWKCDLCGIVQVSGIVASSPPIGWTKTEVSKEFEERAWDTVVACPNCTRLAVAAEYENKLKSKHNPIGM
jgi:hypothetical protein